MDLNASFKTDIGRKRESNQDSCALLRRDELMDQLDGLFVVADGMGGGRGGDIASQIVAQTVPDALTERLLDRDPSAPLRTGAILRDAIVSANARVWTRAVEQPDLRGMGTTCVCAAVVGNQLTVGNVGDSRAYLLRRGRLSQLTEDHSEVWEQVKVGAMTREQARRSKYRNAITRAMGIGSQVTPDVIDMPLEEGDTLLLCSDGLTTECDDEEIAHVLAAMPTSESACDRLVETALRRGGGDNVTVLVVRYGKFTPIGAPPPLPDEDAVTDEDGGRRTANREDEEEPEDFEPQPGSRRSGSGSGRSRSGSNRETDEERAARGGGLPASTLIVLLLILCIAEAGALYLTTKGHAPAALTLKSSSDETPKPTSKSLEYDNPQIFFKAKTLQDAPLTMDPDGNLYAVTAGDARIVRIDPSGQWTPVPAAGTASMSSHRDESAWMPLSIVFDESGARYQVNRAERCIDKYISSTRVAQIAKHSLRMPTAVAVDKAGNLFVIDTRRIMKIPALPSLRDRDVDGADKSFTNGTP